MDAKIFADRRRRLGEALQNNSLLVLFSGDAPVKSEDETFPYNPNRDFYYVTGLPQPNLALLLHKSAETVSEILFVQRPDPVAEKWTGHILTTTEAKATSGISQAAYVDVLTEKMTYIFRRQPVTHVYLDLPPQPWQAATTPAQQLGEDLRRRRPDLMIRNAHVELANLRSVKSEAEVTAIRRAIEVTRDGILSMMSHAHGGMKEHELEAHFDFVLKQAGVTDFAFPSIVAGGHNATVLHYSENNQVIGNGDLVLTDVGAQMDYYNGDITRTFPVNGKFNQRQKQLYEIVLRTQQAVLDAIAPGVAYKDLNKRTRETLIKELQAIGLIDTGENQDEQLSEYYFHNVSHSLGLDTHDVWPDGDVTLVPGMVLTVEPGIYVPEEHIGIRIEDNVVVTTDGCRVLSPDIPKTVDEIEAYMAHRDQ
ncbi:M24 family metallopeptidase [Alicyclobacillaceae bacterium I2511]|nr:M24 family metallopeptidase [Alicyclobacillaceae bacterium I2511]